MSFPVADRLFMNNGMVKKVNLNSEPWMSANICMWNAAVSRSLTFVILRSELSDWCGKAFGRAVAQSFAPNENNFFLFQSGEMTKTTKYSGNLARIMGY